MLSFKITGSYAYLTFCVIFNYIMTLPNSLSECWSKKKLHKKLGVCTGLLIFKQKTVSYGLWKQCCVTLICCYKSQHGECEKNDDCITVFIEPIVDRI